MIRLVKRDTIGTESDWGSSWGPNDVAALTSAQDAWNARLLQDPAERPARERSKELAEAREAYSRKLLERRLPRRLHWLLDHTRALRVLLRLVPRWRPTMGIVRLNDLRFLKHGGMAYFTASAAVQAADVWLGEMEARGVTLDGGHVFTYTDVGGLPAEVYGP